MLFRSVAVGQKTDTFCMALESVAGKVHRVVNGEDGLLILRGLIEDRGWESIACSDAEFLAHWREALGSSCHLDSRTHPIPREELLEIDAGLCTAQIGIADRKSTRLNSSHVVISYAVFCLKKKHYDTCP